MSNRIDIDYAIVSSFERAKNISAKKRSGHVFTVALMALFFIMLMICLAAGVRIYQGVFSAHMQADAIHMQSGLIANIVRINDAADAVELGEGPEGPALVFVERLESGTFETRVYRFQGTIVQEYAIAGRPYNPANAIRIMDSAMFSFGCKDGIVSITTDDGAVEIALRTPQSASELAPDATDAGDAR